MAFEYTDEDKIREVLEFSGDGLLAQYPEILNYYVAEFSACATDEDEAEVRQIVSYRAGGIEHTYYEEEFNDTHRFKIEDETSVDSVLTAVADAVEYLHMSEKDDTEIAFSIELPEVAFATLITLWEELGE